MELGVKAATADLGLKVVTQIPPTWGVEVQTPILDAMVARGDIDYLVIAPTDKDQMIAPLQQAMEAGIRIITLDTFLGDGDYANGPVTFPISAIGSDNTEGGRISDLAGVFGTNVFSAQGAGTSVVNVGLGGAVQVVAYDATQFAIEQLREGVISLVLAQKPFDMGYMAVQFGGLTVVDDVDLDIYPGEVVALLGDNGAGKSTLIKCVSGAHTHTKGTIIFRARR